MTEEELAKRLVATEVFRWVDGMITERGWRIENVHTQIRGKTISIPMAGDKPVSIADLPLLSDGATLGGLLVLARTVYGPLSFAKPPHIPGGPWAFCTRDQARDTEICRGKTEAEVLVFALEGAS